MRGPHRLKSGDRFIVGQYIIAAALDSDGLDAEAASSASKVSANASEPYGELWGSEGAVAPPIDPRQLRTPSEVARSSSAEFLDWAASVPRAEPFNSSNASAFTKQTSDQAGPAEDTWGTNSAPAREYSNTSAAPSLPPPLTPSSPQASPAVSPQHPAAPSDASAERAVWNNQDEAAEPVQTSPFLSPARAKATQRPVAPPPGPASQPARPASIDGAETDAGFLRMFATRRGFRLILCRGRSPRDGTATRHDVSHGRRRRDATIESPQSGQTNHPEHQPHHD